MADSGPCRYEVNNWKQTSLQGWWAHIYIGGDLKTTEMVCREACFPKGLCVTVEPVKYIFAGGTEDGVRVGLIQYPPFEEEEVSLWEKAENLGKKIAEANFQWSFTLVTPEMNTFYSRRK